MWVPLSPFVRYVFVSLSFVRRVSCGFLFLSLLFILLFACFHSSLLVCSFLLILFILLIYSPPSHSLCQGCLPPFPLTHSFSQEQASYLSSFTNSIPYSPLLIHHLKYVFLPLPIYSSSFLFTSSYSPSQERASSLPPPLLYYLFTHTSSASSPVFPFPFPPFLLPCGCAL